ncbi:MAG: homoserine kinase [Peptococcaceae bacterium]|nr:homoserine kinase [Peptococcaceae bacterium]
MIRVQVPATTANLGPGFDCVGMALELYNVVEMVQTDKGLSIEVSGEGADFIARDSENLVYRSARQVFKQAGFHPDGLRINLANNIPVARGLGSSTAAIVGGVIAANILSGRKLAQKDLINLASSIEGHPDNVAAAVLGGIVISYRTDDEISCVKIQPPENMKCVLAIPDFYLPTKSARDVLPYQIPLQDVVFNLSRVALLVAALHRSDFTLLSAAMEDRLHQPFRAALIPGLKKVLAAAKLAGAKGVTISGAGPAVIALADSNAELIANVMGNTFRENGIQNKTVILKPSPVGARALEMKVTT